MTPNVTYDQRRHQQLRAEALCAELMENGLSFDEFSVVYTGAFRKSYRNDIDSAGRSSNGFFSIEINRDGFYDRLPEGLFHQTRGGGNTSAVQDMVAEYRRYRDEEKQARKFFRPLEQECFRYAVATELEERRAGSGMLNGNLHAGLYRFWDISPAIPQRQAAVLVLIMPWLRQIKGDADLTAKALALVLGRPVSVTVSVSSFAPVTDPGFVLGEASMLGEDTVCGNHLSEPGLLWTFCIQGIPDSEAEAYTPAQPYGRLLKRFEELFIPLDTDVCFDYKTCHTGDSSPEPVLGFGFYL